MKTGTSYPNDQRVRQENIGQAENRIKTAGFQHSLRAIKNQIEHIVPTTKAGSEQKKFVLCNVD